MAYPIRLVRVYDTNINESGVFGTNEQLLAYCKGRYFDPWIDDDSRSNGYNAGDLIDTPGYIIESILRDEVFTERDLQITDDTLGIYDYEISALRSTVDDYYNGAYLHDVEKNSVNKITDYVASTKTITIQTPIAGGYDIGDNIYITNIQGSSKIDYASFDAVGNTTNGTRKLWQMARSINNFEDARSIIDNICYESFLYLGKSYNKYKLFAIEETAATPDTWTTPINQNGKEMLTASTTGMDFLVSDFSIKFAYNHSKGLFSRDYSVNDKDDNYGGANSTYCASVISTYGVKNSLSVPLNWIQAADTAELFLDKLVLWHNKLRLLVSWGLTMKDGIKYEIGDIVLLDHSLIPDTLRATAQFMITGKKMILRMGDPFVIFELIQLS